MLALMVVGFVSSAETQSECVTALLTAGVFLLLVSRRGVLLKIGAGFLGFAILFQFLMIAVIYSNIKYYFN